MRLDKDTIRAGKVLFERTPFVGDGGKACATCHTKTHVLRRAVLKKRKERLYDQVVRCITLKDRVAGKKLEAGSKEAFQIGAYLISRYRLPFSQLDAFITKTAAKD